MQIFRVILVLLSICACSFSATDRDVVSLRHSLPNGFLIEQEVADPQGRIYFTVLLRQRNLDRLEQVFHEVSNPRSENYGQFLTKSQLDSLVRAEPEAFDEVAKWLSPVVGKIAVDVGADAVKIGTTVAVASELLGTQFKAVKHVKTGKIFYRHFGAASVPSSLAPYVHFVAGISELIMPGYSRPHFVRRSGSSAPAPTIDIAVTPAVLRSYYNVPPALEGTNRTNLQGVAAFDQYFSDGALAAFEAAEGLPAARVTRLGADCYPDCSQGESDLDVQYMTAMGRNVSTFFVTQSANYWILEFTEQAVSMSPLPQVFSISYGWAEDFQCDIASINCAKYGYDSLQYVNRTNTDFQKLGAMGVTVLVASGDDGAPGLGGASGNCPIDNSVYCPLGGCTHTTSQCQAFTVVNETSGSTCFFPMGFMSDSCVDWLNDPNVDDMLTDFMDENSVCDLDLEQDSDGYPQVYSTCGCSDTRSVSTHGYRFSPYVFNQSNGAVFTADFPASSPFVTSVGATQFLSWDGVKVRKEIPADVQEGAIFTTGGGFSSFQTQPSYQASAVQQYLKAAKDSLPPSFAFNPTMRGFPDIVFNGHNYQIYVSTADNETCPCETLPVDGTSASSPALSGLISLINDQLLNNGKSTIGFLNYLLYQMQAQAPQAFHDINEGSSRCNRAWCCEYGFSAAKSGGWNPVSGLGSPNFVPFMNYVLEQKGLSVRS